MMVASYWDIKEWRAEPLRKAAERVKKDADALEESRDEVELETVPSSWLGRPRVAAAKTRDRLVKLMNTHLEGKRQVQKALFLAGHKVERIESLVNEVEAHAELYGVEIDYNGKLRFRGTPPPEETKKEIRRAVEKILRKAAVANATITDSIPADHVEGVDMYGTPSLEVARYWATIGNRKRAAIIEQLIEELAKENGIDPDTIDRELLLDRALLRDPYVFGVVAGEVRRARQLEAITDADRDPDLWTSWWEGRALPLDYDADAFDKHEEDGITREQVAEWKEDFEDGYRIGEDPEDDNRIGEDPEEPPSEVDVRNAQRELVEGMTRVKLKQLLEERRLRLIEEGLW